MTEVDAVGLVFPAGPDDELPIDAAETEVLDLRDADERMVLLGADEDYEWVDR